MIAKPLDAPAIIFVVTLFASLTLIATAAELAPSWGWAAAAMVHYAALCWFVLKYMPAAFVLLLWFIFLRFTAMISGIAIESGGWMPELLLSGQTTGAFIRLEAVFMVSILFLSWFLTKLIAIAPRIRSVNPIPFSLWSIGVIGALGLLCLCALFIGLQNGFPAITGVDRILYWQQVDSRFLFFFLGNRPMFVVFLGLIYAVCRRDSKATHPFQGLIMLASLGVFIIILLLSLLFAEKFTSIAMILFSFATPVFLLNEKILSRLTSRLLPLGAALVLITTPAILVAYGVFDNPDAAIERLQIRATSQAQLWYIEDASGSALLQLDAPKLKHNIAAMLSRDPESYARNAPYLGARDYMAAYMEVDRYKHYLERGVTLTLASEAYLLKLFGYLGMIVPYAVLLAVYALYCSYFYYAIISANPISLFLAAKLLVWANFGLNQGYFYFVFGFKPLMLLIVIAAFEIGMRTILKERKA